MSRISTAAPKQQDDYDAIVGVVVNTLADHWQVADPGPNCNGPSTGDEHIFTGKVPMFVGRFEFWTIDKSTFQTGSLYGSSQTVNTNQTARFGVGANTRELFKLFARYVANVFGIHSNRHFRNSAGIGVGSGDKSCETLSEECGMFRPLTWPTETLRVINED